MTTAPSLMSARDLESYAAFLTRIAGKRRGSLPDHLRRAAAELTDNAWGFLP